MNTSRYRLRTLLTVVLTGLLTCTAAPAVAGTSARTDRARSITIAVTKAHTGLGGKVIATGRVRGGSGHQLVQVGYRLPGGVVTVASARTTVKGLYRVRVPSNWAGTHTLLAVAPAVRGYRAAASGPARYTVALGYRPKGSRAAVAYLFGTGSRFDPCKPITYRVNLANAPAGAVADLKTALSRISAVSGYQFRYAGTSRYLAYARSATPTAEPGTNLVVSWSTARSSTFVGSNLGLGGGFSGLVSRKDGAGRVVYERDFGQVAINTPNLRKYHYGRAGHRSLLMHEVSHALGLSHVSARNQIMYPDIPNREAKFGAGDIAGLSRLGLAAGCLY